MKTSKPEEHVVLVDEHNTVLGTADKAMVHTEDTPLHRAFSLFLFKDNKLLLQQRASHKKTWPLVWSNSCCGHPALDEDITDAAKRRLKEELGITESRLRVMLPDYRYRAEKDGVVENEICPVLVGTTTQEPSINPEEVEATKWIAWDDWIDEVSEHADDYSPWCIEETYLLNQEHDFQSFLRKN